MKKHRMRKRISGLLSLLAAAVLVVATCVPAMASETGAATAANLDRTKEGYIEIRPRYNGTYLTDGTFSIYRVADVEYDNGSLTYVITEEFAGSGLGDQISREALLTDEELLKDAALVEALISYALENDLTPVGTDEVTEESRGWIRFRGVTAGLYLIVQTGDSTGFETAEPFLVTYPQVGSDGAWDYYVDATTKMSLIPIPEIPEDVTEVTEIPVSKEWVDEDDAEKLRPESVTAVLYADGEACAEAVLSEANDWTYVFTDLPVYPEGEESEQTAIVYTVAELIVPEGYEAEVSGDAEDGFVITNTHSGEEEEDEENEEDEEDEEDEENEEDEEMDEVPLGGGRWGSGSSSGGSGTARTKLPQTGQLNWPIPLLAIGGIFLFILGWALNRSVRRESSQN